MNALETRLQGRMDRRDMLDGQLQALLGERGDGNLSDTDKNQLEMYRSEIGDLDTEIATLASDLEAHNRQIEKSKALRRAMLGATDGVDGDGDGVVYRDFLPYVRDELLARSVNSTGQLAHLAKAWGGDEAVANATARLQLFKRTPANTLTSDIPGLTPSQHIGQIFQVIQTSRPIVQSAQRSTLERLTLTYPKITSKPVVAVQNTEKTEAGNTKLAVDMETATATTYLGGGDISWQAAQFSTPNALELWFRIVTADYALKTEQDAAQVIQHSGFTYNISTTLAALTDFSDVLAAVAAGAGDVYANSGRVADTVYMAPDALYALAAVASTENANFINVGQLNLSSQGGNIGGLNVVVSRGMDAGVIVVGDSQGLLVAENAGAPVELRVTEPAIGGFEVGLIGAFEAVVVDDGAFAMITTAS